MRGLRIPGLQARPAAFSVALGAGLLVVAGLLNSASLYPAGVGFLLIGVGACVWVLRASSGASVARELPARRVLEDEPLKLRLQARGGRGPLPGGELSDPLLKDAVPVPPGSSRCSVDIEARFSRRGRRVLAAPVLIVRDPLRLARVTVSGAGPDDLLVLPRTEPVRYRDSSSRTGETRGLAALLSPVAEAEVDGLRPYRDGTPASRIHWPAAARGAGLMERRMRGDRDTRPLIVLDARCDPWPAGQRRLDSAVRAAASLCLALAADGECALLLAGERRPRSLGRDLAAWPSMHARLALVTPATAPPWGPALDGHAGALIYVSARELRRLPAALKRARGATRLLVVPADHQFAGRTPRFSVSGCAGYVVDRSWRAPRGVAA